MERKGAVRMAVFVGGFCFVMKVKSVKSRCLAGHVRLTGVS